MGGYFMPEPSLHLKDENDLRAALDNPEYMKWKHPLSFQVRSDFIIGIIDEIVAEGKYPYNIDIQRRVEARLNIPAQGENQSPLSRLVYNAQAFRHSDNRRQKGFEPFTEDILNRVGEGGQIEYEGENLLGAAAFGILNVRNIQGKLYAMKPRSRNKHYPPNGAPVKIIKYGKKVNKAG